jgi:hypothetical protein
MILTDEQIAQAWEDCYGEPLPHKYGLVFGRTIRSRQLKAVAEWLIKNKSKVDDVDYVTIIIDKNEWAELLKETL